VKTLRRTAATTVTGALRIGQGVVQAVAAVGRRALLRLARLLLPIAAVVLAVGGTALIVWQPSKDSLDAGTIIGIGTIVATVLSLGLTVTLLVAQHTAERHAHVLYVEFRRERAWLESLGLLAIGVAGIVLAALWHPTVSTGWGAFALMVALGVSAAGRLPRLLDSLDRTVLAQRLTDRIIHDLDRIARTTSPIRREQALQPVAQRGIEIAHTLAVEGVASNDKEVVAAGFAALRRVLIAYIAGSPFKGFSSETVSFAFANLRDATLQSAKEGAVLLLPVAVDELAVLGRASPTVLEPRDNDSVSIPLNSLLIDVVGLTMTNDYAWTAAMATGAIGDGGEAAIRAGFVNSAFDHIRRLQTISLASIAAEKDHVTGRANLELARIAMALAEVDDPDAMPQSLFHDACEAIGKSIDAFVARTTRGGMIRDQANVYIVGPLADYNVARVMLLGLAADAKVPERHGRGYEWGATGLLHSLITLSRYSTGVTMTPGYALDTAYMAVLGVFALAPKTVSQEPAQAWWFALVKRLFETSDRETLDERERLSSLLLLATYAVESGGSIAAEMRDGLDKALAMTSPRGASDYYRVGQARAWLDSGRAAISNGDERLARAIAAVIAPHLREYREAVREHPWAEEEMSFSRAFGMTDLLYLPPMINMPIPDVPDAHRTPEAKAAFDTLLDEYQGPPGSSRRRGGAGSK
jgi:hypothetical protein